MSLVDRLDSTRSSSMVGKNGGFGGRSKTFLCTLKFVAKPMNPTAFQNIEVLEKDVPCIQNVPRRIKGKGFEDLSHGES